MAAITTGHILSAITNAFSLSTSAFCRGTLNLRAKCCPRLETLLLKCPTLPVTLLAKFLARLPALFRKPEPGKLHCKRGCPWPRATSFLERLSDLRSQCERRRSSCSSL